MNEMNNKKKEVKKKESKKEAPDLAKKESRLSAMKRLVRPRKELEKVEKPKKLEKGKKIKTGDKPEDPFTILKFVLMTEKAIQLIEKENKLVFIVDRKYSKSDIEVAAESAFQAAIKDVKTLIDQKGRKRAFIRFKGAGVAGEIAMRLGII